VLINHFHFLFEEKEQGPKTRRRLKTTTASVQDAINDLDIRMALDSFLLSDGPFLLFQRASHNLDASLERGTLERFPGDRIATVSIYARFE
jgi:hypothetical protein